MEIKGHGTICNTRDVSFSGQSQLLVTISYLSELPPENELNQEILVSCQTLVQCYCVLGCFILLGRASCGWLDDVYRKKHISVWTVWVPHFENKETDSFFQVRAEHFSWYYVPSTSPKGVNTLKILTLSFLTLKYPSRLKAMWRLCKTVSLIIKFSPGIHS